MVTKYFESKTAGKGMCWFCDKPTNFIFDNEKYEIFCCLKCFRVHIPLFKKKSKIFQKLCVKHRQVGLLKLGLGGRNGQS